MDIISPAEHLELTRLPRRSEMLVTAKTITVSSDAHLDTVQLSAKEVIIKSQVTLRINHPSIACEMITVEPGAKVYLGGMPIHQSADSQPLNPQDIKDGIIHQIQTNHLCILGKSKVFIHKACLKANTLEKDGYLGISHSMIICPSIEKWTGTSEVSNTIIACQSATMQLDKKYARLNHVAFIPTDNTHPSSISILGSNHFKGLSFYYPNGDVDFQPLFPEQNTLAFEQCSFAMIRLCFTDYTHIKMTKVTSQLQDLMLNDAKLEIDEQSRMQQDKRFVDTTSSIHFHNSFDTTTTSYNWGEVHYDHAASYVQNEHHLSGSRLTLDHSQKTAAVFSSSGSTTLNHSALQASEFTTHSGVTVVTSSGLAMENGNIAGDLTLSNALLTAERATLSGDLALQDGSEDPLPSTNDASNTLVAQETATQASEKSWLATIGQKLKFWGKKAASEQAPSSPDVKNIIVVGESFEQTEASRISGGVLTLIDKKRLKQLATAPKALTGKPYVPGMPLNDLLQTLPPVATSSDQYNCLYHAVLCCLFEYLLASPQMAEQHLNTANSFMDAFNARHNTQLTAADLLTKIQQNIGEDQKPKRVNVEALAPTLRAMTHTLHATFSGLGGIGESAPGNMQESSASGLLAMIFGINIHIYNQSSLSSDAEVYTPQTLQSLSTDTHTATDCPTCIIALNKEGNHFESCGYAGQSGYSLGQHSDHYAQSNEDDAITFITDMLSQTQSQIVVAKNTAPPKNLPESSVILRGKTNAQAINIAVDNLTLDHADIQFNKHMAVELNGQYQAYQSQLAGNTLVVNSWSIVSFGNSIKTQQYATSTVFALSADRVLSVIQSHSSVLALGADLSLPNSIKDVGPMMGKLLLMGGIMTLSIIVPIAGMSLGGVFAVISSYRTGTLLRKTLKTLPHERTFRDWIPVFSSAKDLLIIGVSTGLGALRASQVPFAALVKVKKISAVGKWLVSNPLMITDRALSLVSARNDISLFSANTGLAIGGMHQNFSLFDLNATASITGYEMDTSLYSLDVAPGIYGDHLTTHIGSMIAKHAIVMGQYMVFSQHMNQVGGYLHAQYTNVNIQHLSTHGTLILNNGQLSVGTLSHDGRFVLHRISGDIQTATLSHETTLHDSQLHIGHLDDQSHMHIIGHNTMITSSYTHSGDISGDTLYLKTQQATLGGHADLSGAFWDIEGLSAQEAIEETGQFTHYHTRDSLGLISQEDLTDLRLTDHRSYEIHAHSIAVEALDVGDARFVSEEDTTIKGEHHCHSLEIEASGDIHDQGAHIESTGHVRYHAQGDIDRHNGSIHSEASVLLAGHNITETFDANSAKDMDGTVYGAQGVDRVAEGDIHQTGGVTVGDHVGYYAKGDITLDTQVTHEGSKPVPHSAMIISGKGGNVVAADHNIDSEGTQAITQGRNIVHAGGNMNLHASHEDYYSGGYHHKHKHEEHYRTMVQGNTFAAAEGNFIHADGNINSAATEYNSATGTHLSAKHVHFDDVIGTNIDQKEHHNATDHSKAREMQQYAVKNSFTGSGQNSISSSTGINGNSFDLNGDMYFSSSESDVRLSESRLDHASHSSSHGMNSGMTFESHDVSYEAKDPYQYAEKIRSEVENGHHDTKHDNMVAREIDKTQSRKIGKSHSLYHTEKTSASGQSGSFATWESGAMVFDCNHVTLAGINGSIGLLDSRADTFELLGVAEQTVITSTQSSIGLSLGSASAEVTLQTQRSHAESTDYRPSQLNVGEAHFKNGSTIHIKGSVFRTTHIDAHDIHLILEATKRAFQSTTTILGTSIGIGGFTNTSMQTEYIPTVNITFGRATAGYEEVVPAIFDCKDDLTPDNFSLRSLTNHASILHSHGRLSIAPEQYDIETMQEYHKDKSYSISISANPKLVTVAGSYDHDGSTNDFMPSMYGDEGTDVKNIPQDTFVTDEENRCHTIPKSTHFKVPEIPIWHAPEDAPTGTLPTPAPPAEPEAPVEPPSTPPEEKSPPEVVSPSSPPEYQICRAEDNTDLLSQVGLFHQGEIVENEHSGPPTWYEVYRDGTSYGLDRAFSFAEGSRFLKVFSLSTNYSLHVIGEGNSDLPFRRGAESLVSDMALEEGCLVFIEGTPAATAICMAGAFAIDESYPHIHAYSQTLFPYADEGLFHSAWRNLVSGTDTALGWIANRHEYTHALVDSIKP